MRAIGCDVKIIFQAVVQQSQPAVEQRSVLREDCDRKYRLNEGEFPIAGGCRRSVHHERQENISYQTGEAGLIVRRPVPI